MYQGEGADMTSPDPFAKHCRIFLLQHPQVSLPLHLSLCYGGKTTWKRAALRSPQEHTPLPVWLQGQTPSEHRHQDRASQLFPGSPQEARLNFAPVLRPASSSR